MPTAKALGFKKGDCAMTTSGWPCVLISDVHTATPCCEVWGFAHECGSVYAKDLRKISVSQLKATKEFQDDPQAFTKVAKKALFA